MYTTETGDITRNCKQKTQERKKTIGCDRKPNRKENLTRTVMLAKDVACLDYVLLSMVKEEMQVSALHVNEYVT
jgi:hypothetical protein